MSAHDIEVRIEPDPALKSVAAVVKGPINVRQSGVRMHRYIERAGCSRSRPT